MTDNEFQKIQKDIEAILFTMGDAVASEVIMKALELSEEDFDNIMASLIRKYEDESSGISIIRLEDAYQMCTKRECYEALIKVAATPVKPALTGVMLEVLSIIAYKQPVTRGEIERIRGVSSDYAVNRLLEYGLIEEDGRAETIGRPILFKTSKAFLRQFGLSSSKELPPIDDETITEAREKAFEEAGVSDEEKEKLTALQEEVNDGEEDLYDLSEVVTEDFEVVNENEDPEEIPDQPAEDQGGNE